MLNLIDNHFFVFCLLVGLGIGALIGIVRELIGYFTKSNEIIEDIKLIKFQLNEILHNIELNSNNNSEIEVNKVNALMQKINEIDAFITDYQMFDYDELNNKVDAICRKLEIQI